MIDARIVAVYALRECVRRRVFTVVLILTLLFLALYGAGVATLFNEVGDLDDLEDGVEVRTIAGATIVGLAMFVTLFLGAVLAVFLTSGAVRGDAEQGLLQPLVVRPLGRDAVLAGRFAAAVVVSVAYVLVVYTGAVLITGLVGDWWPDRVLTPSLGLAASVALIAAVSQLGSVFLSTTANGIGVFMVFGAGLSAGLLGQIGEALNSDTLESVAAVASWVLPFEALYQAALAALTADLGGAAGFAVQLGPFGSAEEVSPLIWVWAVVYLGFLGWVARTGFARRDL